MVEAALDWARRGVPVVPCYAWGDKTQLKRPLIPKDKDENGVDIPNTGGVKKATTDPEQIRAWWARWPTALVGGAMGGPLRLLAIDPDAPEEPGDPDGRAAWAELVAEHGGIPATHAQETPNGGRHYLFTMPEGVSHGNKEGRLKGRGINVRGQGGYLILAPSRLADGRAYGMVDDFDFGVFAPAPQWLLDLIAGEPERAAAEAAPGFTGPNPFGRSAGERRAHDAAVERYVAAAVEQECDAVARCAKGGRNIALNDAAFKLGTLIGAGVLSRGEAERRLWDAAEACGHVRDESRHATLATIKSGLDGGERKPRDLSRVRARDRMGGGDARAGSDRFAEAGQGSEGGEKQAAPPLKITATPFVWRDPKTFPRRRWLYGHHLIRKFISCTVAPGGLGKSSLALVEAVAQATGRPLLGITSPEGPLTVWVLNLEDPQEELERRVMAILLQYRIDPSEIEGRLYIDSGRHLKLVVAELQKGGTIIMRPMVEAFTAEIQARGVDVVVLDPFVKSHRVPENDNGAIDMVATVFADIADTCGCAFDLVHHVRKTGGGEITVEDGRGAVALLGAVRSARVLNGMSKAEAEQFGEDMNARQFFRVSNGKLNMAPPPPDRAEWFHLVSVPLGNGDLPEGQWALPIDNGDHVQCVERWEAPDPMATVTVLHLRATQALVAKGEWLEAVQGKDRWVGVAVADAMKLDHTKPAHRSIIKAALAQWFTSGMLTKVRRENANREMRTFVEVGERAD